MADIRQIENNIRDSFAVLGSRDDHLGQPLSDINVADIRCGIIDGRRVIVLPLASLTGPIIKRIGGLKIEMATGLEKYGFPLTGCYLLIWCMRVSLREAFNRLMADLLLDLQSAFTLTDVIRRLEGWKLLLTGTDDKNQEKGLWGELFFLHFLLQNSEGTVDNWSGPLGSTKDFQFQDRRAEVKTTAIRYGWPVTMHGIHQASSSQGVTDFLIFIRVEEDNTGMSISELTAEIRTMLSMHETEQFEERLQAFSPDILNSPRKWTLLDVRIFRIDDHMPAIRLANFTGGTLPEGVLDISYTVDLSGLPSFTLQEWNQNYLNNHA